MKCKKDEDGILVLMNLPFSSTERLEHELMKMTQEPNGNDIKKLVKLKLNSKQRGF